MSDDPIDSIVEIHEGADVYSMWSALGPLPKKLSIFTLLLYFIPLITAIVIRANISSDFFVFLVFWPVIAFVLLIVVWLILSTIITLFDPSGSRRALSVILLVPTLIGIVYVVIAAAFFSALSKVVISHELGEK